MQTQYPKMTQKLILQKLGTRFYRFLYRESEYLRKIRVKYKGEGILVNTLSPLRLSRT